MGPLVPGVLNDYYLKSEARIGSPIALMIGTASILMLTVFLCTLPAYRNHHQMMRGEEAN